MKRTLSTAFVLFVVVTVALAIWARVSFVGSYRVMSSEFSPKLEKGDFVLVPKWSFESSLPMHVRPLQEGDFLVVSEDSGKKLVQLVKIENDVFHVASMGKSLSLSQSDIFGRVWGIWLSVTRPGMTKSKVRWERVLQGIN